MHETDELMPFNIETQSYNEERKSIIKVIGVGGGGGNAVDNMFEEGIENVEFIIANTDIQVLESSNIPTKIQLGASLTEGLGAGNNPEKGRDAAKESAQEITELLSDNTKMVFITAGMGGGTGTGAAPVIAKIARELEILTIGVVTIPFLFEGAKRVKQAIVGLHEMKKHVDALIVINNEKISEVYSDYNISSAFKYADQILTIATKGIAEIITNKGFINVDFADVKSVMKDSGVAVMGTGIGAGEDRGIIAVQNAINSPLLNNNDIRGAKHLLVNIITPEKNEITTAEMARINNFLQSKAGNNANLIWGLTIDNSIEKDKCSVTVIATNFNDNIIPNISETDEINMQQDKQNPADDNNSFVYSQFLNKSDKNQEKKNDTIYDENIIRENIINLDKRNFDFTDDSVVDKLDSEPAYIRQQLSINFNTNNGLNSFLDPRID